MQCWYVVCIRDWECRHNSVLINVPQCLKAVYSVFAQFIAGVGTNICKFNYDFYLGLRYCRTQSPPHGGGSGQHIPVQTRARHYISLSVMNAHFHYVPQLQHQWCHLEVVLEGHIQTERERQRDVIEDTQTTSGHGETHCSVEIIFFRPPLTTLLSPYCDSYLTALHTGQVTALSVNKTIYKPTENDK